MKQQVILTLILKDRKSNQQWKTPNHHKEKRLDDFHREVKEQIMRDIDKKIRRKMGDNCNIGIEDGKIIIISQKFDKSTGLRVGREYKTALEAERYFDKLPSIVLNSILKFIKIEYELIIYISKISNDRILTIYIEF